MKRVFLAFLVAVILSASWTPAYASADEKEAPHAVYVRLTQKSCLYKSMNLKSPCLSHMPLGKKLRVYAVDFAKKWVKISYIPMGASFVGYVPFGVIGTSTSAGVSSISFEYVKGQ